ncbi:N-acetyltransferase [Actinopolyspora erythraea]|uniref:Acetyltransferase n=1 Tax=Actinopolyspora erythraea TaxID=414996 RepID=A0A099D6D0_9ACTN|nr:GNAT family N-acetyltransferase [Actinopolyspora erythraea]ASU80899.1 N-acetyltransferase [Actinopolyspora erythraea]KGI81728.1 acetyltransferase [Actinopolyspora erythraea]
METVTIRRALPTEFDTVGELTARAYLAGGHIAPDNTHYLPVLRDAADRAAKAELLVAVRGEEVCGTVTVARHGGEYTELARPGDLEFRMLAVAPEAAGAGVGRALVGRVLDLAGSENWERVVMYSDSSMTVAHGLYRGMGFRRVPEDDREPVAGVRLLAFALRIQRGVVVHR